MLRHWIFFPSKESDKAPLFKTFQILARQNNLNHFVRNEQDVLTIYISTFSNLQS